MNTRAAGTRPPWNRTDPRGNPQFLTARLGLRAATGTDFLAFAARLFSQSSQEREPGLPYEGWRYDPTPGLPRVSAIDDERRQWLAIEDRQTRDVVGLIELLLPAADAVPWIGLLVIEPRRRNCGLGGEVLAAVERWLAADGWAALHLSVALANTGARRFWERQGYREIADAWRRYDGLPPTSLVLAKSLKPAVSDSAQNGRRGPRVGRPRASRCSTRSETSAAGTASTGRLPGGGEITP